MLEKTLESPLEIKPVKWGLEISDFESQFLGRLIRIPGFPRKRDGSGALKEEIGVWNSQGGRKDTFFFSTFLSKDSVQLSRVRLFATPWSAALQASLFITNSQSPPKPMSIESVMPSNHLILYHPLLLLPSILPSIRIFSNESVLRIRWPKYWSFSFNISPSNEHPRQISFRMDWMDLLAVQGTLKSLLQQHSSKVSIVHHWAFFIGHLSHPYMTSGKTIPLIRQT